MSWGDNGKARATTDAYREGMDRLEKNREIEALKQQRDDFQKALADIALQSSEEGNNDEIFDIACKALEGAK